MKPYLLLVFLLLFSSSLLGDELEDDFGDGFDEDEEEIVVQTVEKKPYYFLGKLEQKANHARDNKSPHNGLNSLQTSLYVESEYEFNKNHKLRVSAKVFYDFIYDVYNSRNYTQEEKDELRFEAEVFDLYLQGKITPTLDYKIGRQVVVWGRSDTIRITDVLNPLDSRSPGVIDIEDLRLPVGMLKLDYYEGAYNANVIVIGETRYTKNPVFGSDFYPFTTQPPQENIKNNPTIAFSFNGSFTSWDFSLYATKTRSDSGHIELVGAEPKLIHENLYMLGYALNYIYNSWLFKSEAAYFDGYKFLKTGSKTFSEVDVLVGVEYNGIRDTLMAIEIANKHINSYDTLLKTQNLPVLKNTTQYAFRANSDFLNASLKGNYLVSLFGKGLDEGGFQRVWFDYEINDNINSSLGYVDYIGGSILFDAINDNDMLFASLKYSF